MYQLWRGECPGDACVADLIAQPIFEESDQDVLWPVGEPVSQVAKLMGVLGQPSLSLADGLDVVSSFVVSQWVLKSLAEHCHESAPRHHHCGG